MSVFGENDSHCLSNILKTHIFLKYDHISRTYNQINYRNVLFPKVIIILLMTAQVLFIDVFSEKDPHLNAVEHALFSKLNVTSKNSASVRLVTVSILKSIFLKKLIAFFRTLSVCCLFILQRINNLSSLYKPILSLESIFIKRGCMYIPINSHRI